MMRRPADLFSFTFCVLSLLGGVMPAMGGDSAVGGEYFAIQVVDEQTDRGVPLVKLETVNNVQHFTDSHGLVAYLEPGLMNQEVFFHVSSHGYECRKDGFGFAGVRLKPTAGGSATIKVKRINVAERLYRVTGQGIYRDSVLLGRKCPTSRPTLNGLVMGCDSVMNVEYRGKLHWFWGDTGKPSYPLGNFYCTGATSLLPGEGGLDPDDGVDFTYFVGQDGFVKGMTPMSKAGPTWPDGFVVLKDETQRERLYAAYTNVNTNMEALKRGLCVYNDEQQVFEKIESVDLKAPIIPGGHPFKLTVGGTEYVYFAHTFPFRRVRADARSFRDLGSYEAFTCLAEGTPLDQGEVDRDDDGRVRYAWRHHTPVLSPEDEGKLVKAGKLKPDEALLYLRDVDSGKPFTAHAGSVYFNEYRRRWVLIVCEVYGTSMLGETWYAEADAPLGPWVYARKIVTHDTYSFYNPKQHPMFARQGGRIIYFEGTYTHTFSGNPVQTPRYDYNQIMYKLDLDDPRMVLPVPVYVLGDVAAPAVFATAGRRPPDDPPRPIAFFAPDRSAPDLIAVVAGSGPPPSLTTRPAGDAAAADAVAFYALPADAPNAPATTVPLHEYTHESDGRRCWSADPSFSAPGYRRADRALCRVWHSPTSLRYPLDAVSPNRAR
ncbi:MAG: hypothetical protein HY718_21440 [Planctomycetes bacterium]|nr:hypothetical protein [Planctomycetota bacterium]